MAVVIFSSMVCDAQITDLNDIKTSDKIYNKNRTFELEYIYDYESILSIEERKNLEEIILAFHKDTKKEILVITTHSIGDFPDVQSYATNLGNIYSEEAKNEKVIVIVISKTLKSIEIATSDEVRKVLTDSFCERLIKQSFVPKFRNDKFYHGLKQGLSRIIIKWQ